MSLDFTRNPRGANSDYFLSYFPQAILESALIFSNNTICPDQTQTHSPGLGISSTSTKFCIIEADNSKIKGKLDYIPSVHVQVKLFVKSALEESLSTEFAKLTQAKLEFKFFYSQAQVFFKGSLSTNIGIPCSSSCNLTFTFFHSKNLAFFGLNNYITKFDSTLAEESRTDPTKLEFIGNSKVYLQGLLFRIGGFISLKNNQIRFYTANMTEMSPKFQPILFKEHSGEEIDWNWHFPKSQVIYVEEEIGTRIQMASGGYDTPKLYVSCKDQNGVYFDERILQNYQTLTSCSINKALSYIRELSPFYKKEVYLPKGKNEKKIVYPDFFLNFNAPKCSEVNRVLPKYIVLDVYHDYSEAKKSRFTFYDGEDRATPLLSKELVSGKIIVFIDHSKTSSLVMEASNDDLESLESIVIAGLFVNFDLDNEAKQTLDAEEKISIAVYGDKGYEDRSFDMISPQFCFGGSLTVESCFLSRIRGKNCVVHDKNVKKVRIIDSNSDQFQFLEENDTLAHFIAQHWVITGSSLEFMLEITYEETGPCSLFAIHSWEENATCTYVLPSEALKNTSTNSAKYPLVQEAAHMMVLNNGFLEVVLSSKVSFSTIGVFSNFSQEVRIACSSPFSLSQIKMENELNTFSDFGGLQCQSFDDRDKLYGFSRMTHGITINPKDLRVQSFINFHSLLFTSGKNAFDSVYSGFEKEKDPNDLLVMSDGVASSSFPLIILYGTLQIEPITLEELLCFCQHKGNETIHRFHQSLSSQKHQWRPHSFIDGLLEPENRG